MLNFFSAIITILTMMNGYYQPTKAQPDLVPDLELLQSSIVLQDVALRNLQCSSEESCLTSSAYTAEAWQNLIFNGYRRLMKFSMRVINVGNQDFAPFYPRDRWIWHTCHNHFHSVETFALYDIMDRNGTRVAAGLKASFCLRDDGCYRWGREKYDCDGAPQGITAGCWDNYLNDLDCQWIDITDLPSGLYIFKVTINPDRVEEENFDNNAIVCDLSYDSAQIRWWNCSLQHP